MKKVLFAALAATTMFATPAFAQNTSGVTDSDDTVITANIPAVCEITAPADHTVVVNPTTNGAAESIGNINILCNDPDGFTLTTTSAHPSGSPVEGSPGGLLVPIDNSSRSTASTIAYRVAALGNSLFNVPKQANQLSANPGGFVGGQDVDILFITSGMRDLRGNGPGLAYAGIYRDTVTFTVTSN